jgi:hypothetical protein
VNAAVYAFFDSSRTIRTVIASSTDRPGPIGSAALGGRFFAAAICELRISE